MCSSDLTFPMYDFNACVRLQEINLRHPYRSLDEMQKTVSAKLSELQARFPGVPFIL